MKKSHSVKIILHAHFKIYMLCITCMCFSFQNLQGQSVVTATNDGPWDSAATWDRRVPRANDRAIISKGVTVDITGNHTVDEVVVHGVLRVPENSRFPASRSLTADWVHVNSGGVFQIGTQNNRFDTGNFTLNLTGTNPEADHRIPMANGNTMNMNNNDGFLMAAGGGRLQFFGEERLSFTKLNETAEAGSNSIVVENVIERNFDGRTSGASDGRLNWEVGDEIVIASSRYSYADEDVRTITRVQNYGTRTRLTLNRATTHRHYGEIEEYGRNLRAGSRPATGRPNSIDLRAEVALLSRNIVVKGLDAQDTDNSFGDRARLQVHSSGSQNGKSINGIGGHIMIMNTAGQSTVDGIQMDQMGQAGRLGRYPIHWHFGGDKRGDVVRNSSITNSNNRAVVVHGTDNVLIQGVVAHDVHGHGFFLESGVERGNRFEANIALGIHRTGGSRDLSDPFIVDNSDRFGDGGVRFRTTAAYWITGVNNTFVGNIAAGSEGTAYWIAQPGNPVGGPFESLLTSDEYLGRMYQRNPVRERMGRFDHNSGHSMWTGMIAIPAGHRSFQASNAGRFREGVPYFNNVDPVFSNTTFYKTSTALYPLVTNVTLQFPDFRAADNEVTLMDSDPMRINGGLVVGDSRGNRQRNGPRRHEPRALNLYHGYSVWDDVHFAGYADGLIFVNGIGDRTRPDGTYSGISWENDRSQESLLKARSGVNRQYSQKTLYDVDGSLTSGIGGGAGYTIVPSRNNWIIDTNDGDIIRTDDGGYTGLTKKRVATLQLERRHTSPYENARWIITNRQGRKYSMGGNASERDDDILINRRPRLQVVLGEEYEVEFARAVDLDSEGVRFSLFQYSIPDGSQSVTLRFKGMANVMRPTFFETGEDVQQNSQLRFLRRSNSTTYFPDPSSGDLFVKVFNNGVGVQSGYINMVPVDTPPSIPTNAQPSISFIRPNNNQTLTAPGNLTVDVNASDSDGSISNVRLFINNRLVRQENSAPYDWGLAAQNDSQLKNLSPGTYTLRAVATDNGGATREVSRRITVSNPNDGLCDFTRLNGGGIDIGSGLGRTFIVGNNRRVWERIENRWVRLPDGGFRADRVDVGGAGQAMVTSTDGKIYRYSPDNRWALLSGSGKDVGANGNELYVIGGDDAVYKRNSASRNYIRLNPPVKAKKLDVYSDGNAWIVGTDGFVYQLSNNRWSQKGTFKARDISIAEGTGNVWALSESDGSVYFYEGNRVWSKQSDQTGNHISVGDDNRIWVLNGRGNVFISDCAGGSRRVGEKNIDTEAALVKLYPNPASNQVTISGLHAGTHHITLYNMQGALVLNTTIEANENHTIPLSGIKSGMYILKINGQGTHRVNSLMIQQ